MTGIYEASRGAVSRALGQSPIPQGRSVRVRFLGWRRKCGAVRAWVGLEPAD